MKVAVIGAGVAGLAAAQSLMRAGWQVTIYEKSRGVGGRAATRRVHDCVFDHGAQYFKAPTEELRQLVAQSSDPDGSAAYDISRPVWTFDHTSAISAGDADQNADPKWCWRSGMTALGKAMAQGLDIHGETQVVRLIDHMRPGATVAAERYTLLDRDDEPLGTADMVLLTAPAAQSAAILAVSEIDASLRDDLVGELNNAHYRRCVSITCAYDERPDVPWYALVNTDHQHAISWLACEHDKPGHAPEGVGLLTLQMADDWSVEQWEDVVKGTYGDDGAALPPFVVDALQAAVGLLGDGWQRPRWANAQRWRYSLPSGDADFTTLNTTGSGLYFAGDYVVGQGRVHRAIENGWQVAQHIIGE